MTMMSQAMGMWTTPAYSHAFEWLILVQSWGWVLTLSPQREAPSSLVQLVSRAGLVNAAPFGQRLPGCTS